MWSAATPCPRPCKLARWLAGPNGFYPGFTEQTGGLLREPDLLERQAGFDRSAWLAAQGIAWSGETLVSLFCYEPPALAGLLAQWAQHGLQGQPVRLLVAAGRAEKAVKAVLSDEKWLQPTADGRSQLSFSTLIYSRNMISIICCGPAT